MQNNRHTVRKRLRVEKNITISVIFIIGNIYIYPRTPNIIDYINNFVDYSNTQWHSQSRGFLTPLSVCTPLFRVIQFIR